MKTAGMVAAIMLVSLAAEVRAGIFGSRGGGCPNGQCGARSYQTYHTSQPMKVVTQAPPSPEKQVAATQKQVAVSEQPAAPIATAESVQSRPSVATQPSRGRILRRWTR